MLRVFDSQLITGGGIGLKTTAPLAGFSWSVDDAGGAESMVMHDVAVAGTTERDRQDARRWLLAYNEDDVRATFCPSRVDGPRRSGDPVDWIAHRRRGPTLHYEDAAVVAAGCGPCR